MATQQVKTCDRYGNAKGVVTIEVQVMQQGEVVDTVLAKYKADLSPRALDWLIKRIEMSLAPPKRRDKAEGGESVDPVDK